MSLFRGIFGWISLYMDTFIQFSLRVLNIFAIVASYLPFCAPLFHKRHFAKGYLSCTFWSNSWRVQVRNRWLKNINPMILSEHQARRVYFYNLLLKVCWSLKFFYNLIKSKYGELIQKIHLPLNIFDLSLKCDFRTCFSWENSSSLDKAETRRGLHLGCF